MIIKEKNCLICDSNKTNITPAKMAPFISARTENYNNEIFSLIHCNKCGFAFYDYRYSQDEINKIYKDYRNEDYQILRQKYESWYSKSINHLIGNDIKAIKSRCENLSKILKDNTEIKEFKNILDYGGDRGQFIPTILKNTNKYVYDISLNSVVDGVILLKNLEDCKKASPNGFDFIMCAHVLEHLTEPSKTIQKIKELIRKEGYLYIEVPFDSPFYSNSFDNIQYLFNKNFKFKDIIKKYIEIKTSKYALMHEHINFYTIDSIKELLQKQGFKIVYADIKKIHSCIGMSKIISILAQK